MNDAYRRVSAHALPGSALDFWEPWSYSQDMPSNARTDLANRSDPDRQAPAPRTPRHAAESARLPRARVSTQPVGVHLVADRSPSRVSHHASARDRLARPLLSPLLLLTDLSAPRTLRCSDRTPREHDPLGAGDAAAPLREPGRGRPASYRRAEGAAEIGGGQGALRSRRPAATCRPLGRSDAGARAEARSAISCPEER